MAEVFEPVIKIETGNSEQSVKGLKKEISDLKDAILNLDKGSDAYNEAVARLQADQRKLNEVMSLTKKEAVALEGSYDALTYQMSQLKKEWKATNDEAKRGELGKQIDEINDKLKEMDASVGNFQRNVGNYVSHWEGMPEVAQDFGTAMREMNEQIEPTKQKFESVGKISSGLASGFAVVQGSMALLGMESENLEKTFVKLQAAMAIMQGVKGIGDLVEGVGKAKVAFADMGVQVKNLSKIMGKSGWIAIIMLVVSAIIGLVTWIRNARKESDKFNLSLKEQKELSKDLLEATSDVSAEFETLKREYLTLETKADKEKWLKDNATAFSNLGLAVNDVNAADEIFIKQSDKVIAALKARAKAEALKDKYKEAVKKAEEDKSKLQRQNVLLTGDGVLPEGLNAEDWEYEWGGGQSGAGWFKPKTDAANEYLDNQLKAQEEAIDAAVEAIWGARWEDAEKEAKTLEAEINKYKPKGSGSKDETPQQKVERLVNEFLESVENMEIPDIPIEVEVKPIQMQEEGEFNDRAQIGIKSLEKTYKALETANQLYTENERDRLENSLNNTIEFEEKKLNVIKENLQKAIDNKDYASQLLLKQQLADQEVAIEQAKYKKEKELRDKDKADREKTTKSIINITMAGLQATSDILNKVAEGYETDGEITKEEAKKLKAIRYSTTVIDMMQGIVSAIASAAGMGPAGWIAGGIQAAAIAATGALSLAEIKKQDFSTTNNAPVATAVSPAAINSVPFEMVRNVTSASEIDAMNQDTRVYILESDIQASNKKVSIRESESTF